jgi:hypothetical protein
VIIRDTARQNHQGHFFRSRAILTEPHGPLDKQYSLGRDALKMASARTAPAWRADCTAKKNPES